MRYAQFPLSMMKKKSLIASQLMFCILFFTASMASSSGAELTNIVVRINDEKLLVDLNLKGVFTDKMKAAVLKGLPVEIVFSVSMYEVRDFWFDKKLISKTAINRITYDALKKEYSIHRSWKVTDSSAVKDSWSAERILSEVKGFEVITVSGLTKGAQHQIRVKSELYDHGILFSETPWGFKTDWYTINFIY